jgi:hypothetical protein
LCGVGGGCHCLAHTPERGGEEGGREGKRRREGKRKRRREEKKMTQGNIFVNENRSNLKANDERRKKGDKREKHTKERNNRRIFKQTHTHTHTHNTYAH